MEYLLNLKKRKSKGGCFENQNILHRIGAKEMHYIQEDNISFLLNLYKELKEIF